MGNCQWIFIDESGKPEVFSSKGVNLVKDNKASKYLVLAAVRSNNQLLIQQQITEFRLSLLKDEKLVKIFSSAYTLDAFHAQTDYPEVKHMLYEYISTLDVKIDVIVVDSVAALTPKDEIEGDMGAYHVGKQARLMSQALRKLTAIVAKSKTIVIFIKFIILLGIRFANS